MSETNITTTTTIPTWTRVETPHGVFGTVIPGVSKTGLVCVRFPTYCRYFEADELKVCG